MMLAHIQHLGMTIPWDIPHAETQLMCWIKERYVGLRGQERIAIVDPLGRIYHYDCSQIEIIMEGKNINARYIYR